MEQSSNQLESRFEEEPWIENEVAETKTDFVTLLLAYNLQFRPRVDENLLIKSLAERSTPSRYFLEAILHLFEVGVDPVRDALGGGSENSNKNLDVNSVDKLLQDMFSSKITAEHFGKPDMKRLTDSIYENVSQLGPGIRRRTDNLNLLWLVLRNRAFQYRTKEVGDALVGILLEDDPLSIPDQKKVKCMSKEFPAIFKEGDGGSSSSSE